MLNRSAGAKRTGWDERDSPVRVNSAAPLSVRRPGRTLSRLAAVVIFAGAPLGAGSCGVSPPPVSGVTAVPLSSGQVRISWSATSPVPLEVRRDGHLLDVVPAASGTFLDSALWPGTRYRYQLRGSGTAAREVTVRVPAGAAGTPALYAADSFWNTRIGPSPAVDPRSDVIVAEAFAAAARGSRFANDPRWGIPVAYAQPATRSYEVACRTYSCAAPVVERIPRAARPSRGDDGHLVVLGPDGVELDLWRARYDEGADAWSAGSRFVTDTAGPGQLCRPPERCNASVTAGFAQLAGVVRPEEVAAGRIEHALALSVPDTLAGSWACPATHSDATRTTPGAVPIGAHVQLDPALDVAAQDWPAWTKVLAVALQEYGGYVTDTGGHLVVRGEAVQNRGYDAWARAATPVSPSLSALPWERLRVLQLTTCGTR